MKKKREKPRSLFFLNSVLYTNFRKNKQYRKCPIEKNFLFNRNVFAEKYPFKNILRQKELNIKTPFASDYLS